MNLHNRFSKRKLGLFVLAGVLLVALVLGALLDSPGKYTMSDAKFVSSEPERAYDAPSKEMSYTTESASWQEIDRKVIYTGSVNLEVTDLDRVLDSIVILTKQSNGYINNLSTSIAQYDRAKRTAYLTIRVPFDTFDGVMAELKSLGVVTSSYQSESDVTEEYIDLTARITNLRAQEDRLRTLLDKANTIEEIMQIERELTRVRSEIDSIEGRLRYLTNRVDYATINISIIETELASQTISGSGFGSIIERGIATFVKVTNYLLSLTANMLVGIFALVPILIWLAIIGGILYGVYRLIKIVRKERP